MDLETIRRELTAVFLEGLEAVEAPEDDYTRFFTACVMPDRA